MRLSLNLQSILYPFFKGSTSIGIRGQFPLELLVTFIRNNGFNLNGIFQIMLKPLLQEFINRKEAILRFPVDVPVMYYAKELLSEIELPEGFGMLESKDLLALQYILEQADMWNEFYNKNTLYGFVEYLALNTKTPRSAFWCKNKKGEVTGFQFIQKGFRIIVEHIHVEDYTYLPIIGIYRN